MEHHPTKMLNNKDYTTKKTRITDILTKIGADPKLFGDAAKQIDLHRREAKKYLPQNPSEAIKHYTLALEVSGAATIDVADLHLELSDIYVLAHESNVREQ